MVCRLTNLEKAKENATNVAKKDTLAEIARFARAELLQAVQPLFQAIQMQKALARVAKAKDSKLVINFRRLELGRKCTQVLRFHCGKLGDHSLQQLERWQIYSKRRINYPCCSSYFKIINLLNKHFKDCKQWGQRTH